MPFALAKPQLHQDIENNNRLASRQDINNGSAGPRVTYCGKKRKDIHGWMGTL